jgi:glucose/arabinose dehydrogenase
MEQDLDRLENLLVQFPGILGNDASLVGRLQQFWFGVTGTGGGSYSNPEFVWNITIAPTAIKFLPSDALGEEYVNDVFVASYTTGYIYHFELNNDRTAFVLDGDLVDRVADEFSEPDELIFARNLGRITDMAIGPDGYLYVLTILGLDGGIYRIIPLSSNNS